MRGLTLKLAWQECLASRVRLSLLALCLAAGVGGVAAVSSFTSQVGASLDANSRILFGGDVAVSDVRALEGIDRFTQQPGIKQHTLTSSMTAMAANPRSGEARLITVTAVDSAYPLLKDALKIEPADSMASGWSEGTVFVTRDLADLWQLRGAATLTIAGQLFRIRGLIIDDLTRGSSLFAMGPAVIMKRSDAATAGLLGKTSRFRETLTMVLDGHVDPRLFVRQVQDIIGRGSSLRVTAHTDRGRGAGQVLSNLRVFLSMIALSTYLLVCLGLATCLVEMIRSRRNDTAIYRVLGAPPRMPVRIMLIVIAVTCLVGSTIGVALGEWIRYAVLFPQLESLLPLPPAPFHWTQLPVIAPLWGLLVPLLAVWPEIKKLELLPPAQVLRSEEIAPSTGPSPDAPGTNTRAAWRSWQHLRKLVFPGAAIWLMLVPFVALSESTRDQPWIGVLVFAINIALFIAFRALLNFMMALATKARGHLPLPLELALGEMAARRLTAFLTMSLVGIGIFYVTLMALIQRDLARNLSADIDYAHKPNLYLLDVQRSQAEGVGQLLRRLTTDATALTDGNSSAGTGPELVQAPMVRARLLAVDGKETTSIIDSTEPGNDQSRGMRQREQNLTWRDRFEPAESLAEGLTADGSLWLPGDIAQVSLEQRFAERIGARLGSWLDFSVLGRPVRARVTSLRSVNWQSFRPNFFVVMHPQLMEGVPHQVLIGLHGGAAGTRSAVQSAVAKEFPNVSVIDATALIARAAGLARSVVGASALLAALLIVGALLILMGTMVATAKARLRGGAILRTLGASSSLLRRALLLEFVLLGAISGALGVCAAQATALVLVRQVLELSSSPSIGTGLLIWFLGAAATCASGYLATRAILRKGASVLLRESTS